MGEVYNEEIVLRDPEEEGEPEEEWIETQQFLLRVAKVVGLPFTFLWRCVSGLECLLLAVFAVDDLPLTLAHKNILTRIQTHIPPHHHHHPP
jgi:hypothetical protein